MKKRFLKPAATTLLCSMIIQAVLPTQIVAQTADYFPKVKMIVMSGKKEKEIKVALRFETDRLIIIDKDDNDLKILFYNEVKSVEYSHTENSPWKSAMVTPPDVGNWGGNIIVPGNGSSETFFADGTRRDPNKSTTQAPILLGAVAAIVFGVIFLFQALLSHKEKHWLIIRTQNDHSILQLPNKHYKSILSVFEVRTGMKVVNVSDRAH